MRSTGFKKFKHFLIFLFVFELMLGGGIILFKQSPQIVEQVEKNRPYYFEGYYFVDRLMESSSVLVYETNNQPIDSIDPSEIAYWKHRLNQFPDELDYYMSNHDRSIEIGRGDKLLKQLIGNEKPNLEILKDHYQFLIEFSVNQKGNLSVKKVYGANEQIIGTLLRSRLPYYVLHQPNLLNGMTFIYGVPLELPANGPMVAEMSIYDEEYYLSMTLPYLIWTFLVVCLVIFVLPFKWLQQSKFIQTLLAIPFELSLLIFIGTGLVAIGLPFLILMTQSGVVLEFVEWFIPTTKGPDYVTWINILAWTLLIAMLSVCAIYTKQWFVLGFKTMLVKQTLCGRMVCWMISKVKTIKKQAIIDHPTTDSKLPIFEVLGNRLNGLSRTLEPLNPTDEETIEVSNRTLSEVKQEVSLMVRLVESQQKQVSVDALSLIQEVANHHPSFSEKLTLRIQESNGSTAVLVHQHQFQFMLDELFKFISQYAIENSRVHVSFKENENLNEVSISFVVIENEEELEEIQTLVQQLIENQKGVFTFLQDGDFVKLSFKLSIPQEVSKENN